MDEFLDKIEEAPDFYCERLGLVKLESWSRGRITLHGGACYCPSANTGIGTTSAIVGAYVLAAEISKHSKDVSAALEGYEEIFRPFMAQVQAGVLETAENVPSSKLGIALLNGMLRLASLFRINVFGRYILKEYVKGWTLPECDSMTWSRGDTWRDKAGE